MVTFHPNRFHWLGGFLVSVGGWAPSCTLGRPFRHLSFLIYISTYQKNIPQMVTEPRKLIFFNRKKTNQSIIRIDTYKVQKIYENYKNLRNYFLPYHIKLAISVKPIIFMWCLDWLINTVGIMLIIWSLISVLKLWSISIIWNDYEGEGSNSSNNNSFPLH